MKEMILSAVDRGIPVHMAQQAVDEFWQEGMEDEEYLYEQFLFIDKTIYTDEDPEYRAVEALIEDGTLEKIEDERFYPDANDYVARNGKYSSAPYFFAPGLAYRLVRLKDS